MAGRRCNPGMEDVNSDPLEHVLDRGALPLGTPAAVTMARDLPFVNSLALAPETSVAAW